MDRGLFFFILGLASIWLVLDEFVGKKRLTTFAGLMTPDLSMAKEVKQAVSDAGEKLNEKAPDIFHSNKDPDDKKKKSYFEIMQEKIMEQSGHGST